MVKKSLYEAPALRFLELRYEESFLQGSNTGGFPGGDDDYDDQGDF